LETSAGIRGQSEGKSNPTVLQPLRQALQKGCVDVRLEALPCKRGQFRSGRAEFREDREGGGGKVVGWIDERTQGKGISARGSKEGLYSKSRREATAVGHPNHPGPGGADGGGARSGADI